jgi:hypothetical protein
VLPVVVIAGTAACAWLIRRAQRRLPATQLVLTGVLGIVALVVPPVIATAPLAGQRTEQGELGALHEVCAALKPGDAVVAVDNRGFNEWPQVIRGVCGYPAAALTHDGAMLALPQLRSSAQRLADLVRQQGGRLVLLAAAPEDPPRQLFAGLGLTPREVTHVATREDERLLASPPRRSAPLLISVWLADWESDG